MDAVALVERYLAAVADPAAPPHALDALVHPDYRVREWPNALNPGGTARSRTEALAALAHSRSLLADASIEVHGHVATGEVVATRLTWRGRLAVDAGPLRRGAELVAHVSQHFILRDGRIWRDETFDCYEPLPAGRR